VAEPVVVIGGGVGGLCAAIRLQAADHQVTLLERNDTVGGKLAARTIDGFSFDTGPSLLTLPAVFDEVFALADSTLAGEVTLDRLDPQCRYRWRDGSSLDVHDDVEQTMRVFDAFAPGAGAQLRELLDRSATTWSVSERTFFAGPMASPRDLMKRMRSPRDLLEIDPLRTLAARARSTFDDPRLQQWLGRYATYSGSSPYLAPATLGCITHIEQALGAWHIRGGLVELAQALEQTARRLGVEIRTSTDVAAVEVGTLGVDDGVTGVRLVTGERLAARIVICNADAEHLYRDLLPDSRALAKVQRAPRSTSGFALLIGVDGRTENLAHHNIGFSGDSRAEFAALERGELADDPTVYVCASSVTDPSQAPPECENWFVLANVPSGDHLDWTQLTKRYTRTVMNTLARHGWDVSTRARFVEPITPADIARNYRAPGGAIYGTSSNGTRSAFLRPNNIGARRGLYLVGGSSHPGGGLPLVATSARIVAEQIAAR
jgi:phytoene desaturase